MLIAERLSFEILLQPHDSGGTMNAEDLAIRTKKFAVRIVRLSAALPRTREAEVLGRQVLRSGTSIGANYREARRARSRPDFLSKIVVCTQEPDETCYWLELLGEAEIVKPSRWSNILDEASQLVAIFTASGRTASKRKNGNGKRKNGNGKRSSV